MLNPVGRYGWSLHNDTLRPSLLGHAAARKAHTLEKSADGDDDPDEAPRSAETKAKQHQALGTLWNGDVSAHAAALDEVITSWRKDNAAGGRGVFEHLPLPRQRLVGGTIGQAVAHVLRRLGPMSQAEAAKQIGP